MNYIWWTREGKYKYSDNALKINFKRALFFYILFEGEDLFNIIFVFTDLFSNPFSKEDKRWYRE